MRSPYRDLSYEEFAKLSDQSSSGKNPIFVGELLKSLSLPNTPKGHRIHEGRYFEVSPEELIDVAKHVSEPSEPPEKTIERAYAIICEANLVARKIKHWNEGQSRQWRSAKLETLLKKYAVVGEGEDQLIPKGLLLKEFLNEFRLRNLSEDKSVRLFNEFIKDTVRTKDFVENAFLLRKDELDLHNRMFEKGWFQTITIDSVTHFLPPKSTKKPTGKTRKELREGEHITRPYWETTKVWWPAADKEAVKELKDRWLTSKHSHFADTFAAGMALEEFDQWLDIQDAVASENSKSARKGIRDEGTGQFAKKNEKSI